MSEQVYTQEQLDAFYAELLGVMAKEKQYIDDFYAYPQVEYPGDRGQGPAFPGSPEYATLWAQGDAAFAAYKKAYTDAVHMYKPGAVLFTDSQSFDPTYFQNGPEWADFSNSGANLVAYRAKIAEGDADYAKGQALHTQAIQVQQQASADWLATHITDLENAALFQRQLVIGAILKAANYQGHG
jgi:hypothetical protein